jgi:hypothetical protein
MPFWGGYWSWGPAGSGFWWVFPLIGLAMMIVMVFACLRMMGGTHGFGCMGGHHGAGPGDVADLRRELQELKDEVRKFRDRN